MTLAEAAAQLELDERTRWSCSSRRLPSMRLRMTWLIPDSRHVPWCGGVDRRRRGACRLLRTWAVDRRRAASPSGRAGPSTKSASVVGLVGTQSDGRRGPGRWAIEQGERRLAFGGAGGVGEIAGPPPVPLRFSMERRGPCSKARSRGRRPCGRAARRGSVALAWVSFERFSPRKSRSPLRPPSGGAPPPSFGRKLFIDAQALSSVPSTVKWSRLRSCLTRGSASRAARKPWAISVLNSRLPFFENTLASHTGSSMPSPTNQRTGDRTPAAPSADAPSGSSRTAAGGSPAAAARGDRGSTLAGIEPGEVRVQRPAPFHQLPDQSQRMVPRDPHLNVHIGEQAPRPRVRSPHELPPLPPHRDRIIHIRRCRGVPAAC